jgi:CBS domain-containing membrane protein
MKNLLENSRWLLWLGFQRQTVDARERARDVAGAVLGLLLTGGLSWWAWGAESVWLGAPMGASAVLLFAVPSSPLAQPWPMVVGNFMSALVGVLVYSAFGATPLSAALAAGLALALMFPLRCVHPPGGAVAITAVLGGEAVHRLGFGFALVPIALNSIVLMSSALLWRRMTHNHVVQQPVIHANRHRTADSAPQDRVGMTGADLDAALRSFNQLLDIDSTSLEQVLRHAQGLAWQRQFGSVRCADIMSRDLVAVEFATPLQEAWTLLHRHRIRALPVVDRARRVIGVVALVDFLKHARLDPRDHVSLGSRIRGLLAPTPGDYSDKAEVVGQIMTSPVQTAREDEAVVELVPRLSDQGLHHVPVIDSERRLCGMVTQSDLVAALYRSQVSALPDSDRQPQSVPQSSKS